jgi:D-beta-D-heptose 7-phosphate kinase/D-beta-D-heptose 1-phosphate adenosyltransferase
MSQIVRPDIPWLRSNKPIRVAVVGDVILDEYLDGQVNRISPEAPVPVHLVTNSFHGAGGAANAARNIKLAGGEVYLMSVIGNDEAGRNLKDFLGKDQIDSQYLEVVEDRPTIRKTRITANSQQIVRIDWERVHPIGEDVQERIVSNLKKLEFDALLISDYGKGTLPDQLLTRLLELSVARGIPAVVDPKGMDYSKYLHAALITPNRKEACDALGLDPVNDVSGAELGRRLQKTYGLKNILVTLGAKGMVLAPAPDALDTKIIELPALAREVYDVSGAGDTVVAVMALCMAAKAQMRESMHIATMAAGVVVGKWGTHPITLQELETELRGRPTPDRAGYSSLNKLINKETLRHIVKGPEQRSKKIVFTNGCFDIIHTGHVSYLEQAKSLGDILVVGVNTDESVRALKGPTRPVNNLEARMRVLAALGCTDYIVPFAEETPYELISFLIPDVLVKGADWKVENIVGADVVKKHGGKVETITFVDNFSTTSTIERIKKQ